jgi:tRNA(His) guanylyltransferase
MSNAKSLGDRMKAYENAYRIYLPRRLPVIVRLDGKAFHTFTRDLDRPRDIRFEWCMFTAAYNLCNKIQGCQLAYVQSDEISLLLHGYKTIESEPWFGNNLQKIVSVSTSITTLSFHNACKGSLPQKIDTDSHFDSRAWILPEDEVCNYFIWRQQDATRNYLSMLAQSLYSHKELQNKKRADLQEMCFAKGQNWNDLPTVQRRGFCVVKKENTWDFDSEIPIFTQDRNYIERFLKKD